MKENLKLYPLVSICCLTYNHEKYIRRTLDGFISQKTSFPFEVLIHDDASTDNTAAIIEEYSKKYPNVIKPIFQKENKVSQGINVQKKYNYSRAKGKYIAYCEGDDYWSDSTKLQRQIDALENNDCCTISAHITSKINKNGDFIGSVFPPTKIEKTILSLEDYLTREIKKREWTFQLSSIVVRKEVVDSLCNDNISFANVMSRVGDFPLIVYSLTIGKLYFVNREMSCYRCMSGGFMTKMANPTEKEFKISTEEEFISCYKEIDKYTNNQYHNILEYGIQNCQISIKLAEEKFLEIIKDKNEAYNDLPASKKIAIFIGCISKRMYRLLYRIRFYYRNK